MAILRQRQAHAARVIRHACGVALALLSCARPALPAGPASDEPRTLFEHGLLRRAAAVCEQRLAASASDANAGALLARIRARQGSLDDAIRLATAAAAAEPKNADAQYALAEVYGMKAQSVGMLKAAGYAGKMRKAADAALASDPRHLDALEILVDFHLLAPGFMGGDKKQAAGFVERIAQVDAAQGWLQKGQNAMRGKDTTLAARCWQNAAEVTPPSGEALVQYASWLAPRWRDPARSERLALQAVALEPWRAGGWQVLASLYAAQERWAELDAMLQRSEAAEPSHLGAWYQAARQLIVTRKAAARAEGYLRHYLGREPEIGAPSWAAARWRLGQALEQQGRTSEARTEIETAVKLDPKLEDARKDLKRLRG
jgi:tetratricopeptide (TPR) repeat protein